MDKILVILSVICLSNANSIFNDDASRILNGNVAGNGQFPYVASLQLAASIQQETRGHRCGGVLIDYQRVMTSASCLYDGVQLINPALYRVFAGAALLTNDSSVDRVRAISRFIIPTDYIGPPSYVNDIAVIALQTAFPRSAVQPLSLPSSKHNPSDFTVCTVAGWGSNVAGNTQLSTQLRYAEKYVYNQQLCSNLYNSQANSLNVLPTMMCAASYNTEVIGCSGDNGNALVCDNVLTGILFSSASGGNCVANSYPELYTRVTNYTSWIKTASGSPATTPTIVTTLMLMIVPIISFY